jgi:hypothetical protein
MPLGNLHWLLVVQMPKRQTTEDWRWALTLGPPEYYRLVLDLLVTTHHPSSRICTESTCGSIGIPKRLADMRFAIRVSAGKQ